MNNNDKKIILNMEYLREFETQAQCDAYVNSSDYIEPFIGLVGTDGINYNKTSEIDYRLMPLTIEITNGNGSITFNRTALKYKINDGEWDSDDNPIVTVSNGDKIQVKQNFQRGGDSGSGSGNDPQLFSTDDNLLYTIYGNIMSLYSEEGFENLTSFAGGEEYIFSKLFQGHTGLTSAENLVLPATTLAEYCYNLMFWGCTSLTTAPELPATTLADYCYASMFAGCSSLTTAPELPATTLAESCYVSMFESCTSLTTAPALPATTLADWCYYCMFGGCISLSTAPELPATTLADSCYYGMFQYCSSLTTAPELPATTLAHQCYMQMFWGCTGLTTAPSLPATTLTDSCYYSMFYNCTSLTTAPSLPSTTLAEGCYQSMFYKCTSLNYIKCLATDISANNCTNGWVYNVAPTGTFVKNPNMSSWTTGTSGIPTNWSVQDAS